MSNILHKLWSAVPLFTPGGIISSNFSSDDTIDKFLNFYLIEILYLKVFLYYLCVLVILKMID